MQTQVPQGLQALMALTQSMQSGQVQPMTREGQPTVAGQIAQAVQQQMAPPQPQMAPGMRPMAQQAAQGMQVGMHQEQQEQNRMKELLERMAQSRPDPSQQGIAAAAPDMNFADGGIVGFAGDEGSVPNVDVQALDPDRMMQIIATAKNIPEEERQIVLEKLRTLRTGNTAPPAPPGGGIAGDRPESLAARVAQSQLAPELPPELRALREQILNAKYKTGAMSPQAQNQAALEAQKARDEFLRSLSIPDVNEMQRKQIESQRAAEEKRQAEYEKAKGSRTGITSPGFAKALAAFASAPRRNAFAQMGTTLANEREGFQREDLAEAERRRKFDADMQKVELLAAQGRTQEALALRDKAATDYKASQRDENEITKANVDAMTKIYGDDIRAFTTRAEGEASRATELEKAKMQVNAQLQKVSTRDEQKKFLDQLQDSYTLQLSKLDPRVNADDYNRVRANLIAVQQKLGELVGVNLAQPAPAAPTGQKTIPWNSIR